MRNFIINTFDKWIQKQIIFNLKKMLIQFLNCWWKGETWKMFVQSLQEYVLGQLITFFVIVQVFYRPLIYFFYSDQIVWYKYLYQRFSLELTYHFYISFCKYTFKEHKCWFGSIEQFSFKQHYNSSL